MGGVTLANMDMMMVVVVVGRFFGFLGFKTGLVLKYLDLRLRNERILD